MDSSRETRSISEDVIAAGMAPPTTVRGWGRVPRQHIWRGLRVCGAQPPQPWGSEIRDQILQGSASNRQDKKAYDVLVHGKRG